MKPFWRDISEGRPKFGKVGFKRYFARKQDCAACALKPHCTPNQATRKISRSRHEGARQIARDIATTDAYVTSSYARKKVEMIFTHLKQILRLDRLRLRGPNGARDEFHLAATVQNLANSQNWSRQRPFLDDEIPSSTSTAAQRSSALR